jgi:O-antigen/teichoic acid export membrane protein
MIRKLLSASLIYALAPQLPKLVSLFMMPIITNFMTPTDYGIIGIIMAYMAAFEAFKDLGLRVNLTNSFFKYPIKYKWIWQKIYGFIQLWSIVFGILLAGILWLIIPSVAMNNYLMISALILIPLIFFDPTLMIGRLFFQLSKKPIPISIISVLSGLVTILANYISIVIYRQGYMGLLYGLFISSIFSMICYAYFVIFHYNLKPKFDFSHKWIKLKLKISLPTIPHYFAGYIINVSDIVLLNFFQIPLKDIGLYSFAYSIGAYFSIIGKSYNQASGPFYMEFYKKENREGDLEARNVSYIFQITMLLLAFVLSIWSKEIFDMLSKNDELKNTYLVAIIIFFSYTYYPSYNYNGMKLWYKEKTNVLMKFSVISAVTSVVCNIILIPTIGYFGAAISTFISMLYMGFGGFIVEDINKLFYIKYNWKLWSILTVLLLIFSLLVIENGLLFKAVISVILIIILFAFLLFNKLNGNNYFSKKLGMYGI